MTREELIENFIKLIDGKFWNKLTTYPHPEKNMCIYYKCGRLMCALNYDSKKDYYQFRNYGIPLFQMILMNPENNIETLQECILRLL